MIIISVTTFAVFQKWVFKIFHPEAIAVVLTYILPTATFLDLVVTC